MNHHLPTIPHGQPPIPPSRRQQDFIYTPGPPNMRSPPYMGYPPHMNGMNGHIPPAYAPQQPPPWYPPYGHMQLPPRPFQPPYGPMIVSSYPHSQLVMAPNHLPPHSLHMQPHSSTPLQPSTPPSIHMQSIQTEMDDHSVLPNQQPQHYPVSSPPPLFESKATTEIQPAFLAPVSAISLSRACTH